jgi:glycosyltransferase involved in cell wall biosynthesis
MGKLLKSEVQKHDWILAHWALPAGFAANKAMRRTSGPGRLAVWCHSSDVYALERLPFGKYLARRCLDRAERFFVPSQDLAFRLTRLLGAARPIDVVHPGIELGPPPRPLPLGQFRVLFVGRLESIKGVKLVADLASRQPDWSFTMVGGGAQESELKESSREIPNLNVIGPLPPEEIRAQLDAHHVLLLPGPEKRTKRSEGLPTVILEAFAAGRTVVAGDTGGSSEIVDKSVGVLVPPGDLEACEEALSRLASDPSQLAIFSRAARYRSEAYDSRKIAEKIQTLLTRTS